MWESAKLHVCRICAVPFLRVFLNMESHLRAQHGVTPEEYLDMFGGERVLRETEEERRVNASATGLECPTCHLVLDGFQHFYAHYMSQHTGTNKLRGMSCKLSRVLHTVKDRLGLAECDTCKAEGSVVLKGFLVAHQAYFHRASRMPKQYQYSPDSYPTPPITKEGKGDKRSEGKKFEIR